MIKKWRERREGEIERMRPEEGGQREKEGKWRWGTARGCVRAEDGQLWLHTPPLPPEVMEGGGWGVRRGVQRKGRTVSASGSRRFLTGQVGRAGIGQAFSGCGDGAPEGFADGLSCHGVHFFGE